MKGGCGFLVKKQPFFRLNLRIIPKKPQVKIKFSNQSGTEKTNTKAGQGGKMQIRPVNTKKVIFMKAEPELRTEIYDHFGRSIY